MSRTNTHVLCEQAEKLVLIFVLVLGSKAPSNDDRGRQKFEYLTRKKQRLLHPLHAMGCVFSFEMFFFLPSSTKQPHESPVEGANTRSEKLLYFFSNPSMLVKCLDGKTSCIALHYVVCVGYFQS